MLTVAELLARPNPKFSEFEPLYREIDQTKKSSSYNRKWPNPKILKRWKDFNMDNIDRAFGGNARAALERQLEISEHSELLNLGSQKFHGEESLRSVLDITHRAIVNRALEGSSQQVIGQHMQMFRGDGATLYLLTGPGADKAWPDWAVRSSDFAKHCVLPGETKTSWTWKSAEVRKCVDSRKVVRSARALALRPLRQLAYYCVLSFARYGFLITDKELVVIRISCEEPLDIPKNDVQEWKQHVEENMTIEYEVIPWMHSPGGTRVMTMNLALWFLHLLAGNNGQLCVISPQLVGEESLVEHEQKVQFDARLADSQSQSQPSQTSLHNEELTYATDAPMADSDSLTNPSFDGSTVFPIKPDQQRDQDTIQMRGPNAQGSFTSRNNRRGMYDEARSVLSPKESNTRIQKGRHASLRSKRGI